MNNRRRAIMGIKKSRLPSEYQEVEYLESTGEQYIDTGYNYSRNTIVDIDVMPLSIGTSQCFYGSWNNSPPLLFFSGISSTSAATVGYYNGGFVYPNSDPENLWRDNVSPYVEGQKYHIRQDNGSLYRDDKLIFQWSVTANSYPTSIYLLARNRPGDYSQYPFIGRCFGAIIYGNGTQIRNFIPCYRKADNKPGLYDLVNDVFYTNANTSASTDFFVGPDIN